jgi:hypothetical protein
MAVPFSARFDFGRANARIPLNLRTFLQALSDLFDEVTGHDHATAAEGAPIAAGGIAALSIDTAELAAGAVTQAKIDAAVLNYPFVDVQLNAAAVNGLLGANVQLVASPGANLANIPVAVFMFLDHGGTDFIQVNNSDHLALVYNGGAEIIEFGAEAQCTALLEAAADAALFDPVDMDGIVPEADTAIDLDNNGAAEYTTGDGTLSIRIYYITVPMVAFS